MKAFADEGLEPELVTYNCLVHAYATAKPPRVDEAEAIVALLVCCTRASA